MRGVRLVVLGLLLGVMAVPAAAPASHCGNRVIIFSTNSAIGTAVNSDAVTCSAFEHDVDGRLINPGSDMIRVRLTIPGGGNCDLGGGDGPAETREGHIEGLGLDEDITLTCELDAALGAYRFHSEWLSIDPSEEGCITATVPSEGVGNSFHTVGTLSCPDNGF